MTHKEYTSVDYVCQRLRESLLQNWNEKGGEYPNSYQYDKVKNRGVIHFKIQKLEATLVINPVGGGEYEMLETYEINGTEISRETEVIKPKRSDTNRISGDYLKDFAQERMKKVKVLLGGKPTP